MKKLKEKIEIILFSMLSLLIVGSLTYAATVLPIIQGGTGTSTAETTGIFFADGTTFKQDTANLVWDDNNNRLGIGTTSPYKLLSVAGDGHFDGGLSVDGTARITATSTFEDNIVMGLDKNIQFGYSDVTLGWSENHTALLFGDSQDIVAIDGIQFYANTGADALGNWQPEFEMTSLGYVNLNNTTQGNAGNKYFRINMTDGMKLNTTDAYNAVMKADNIATSDKTFQFPNLNGTFLMATGTQDFITTGSVGIATATPNASYVLDVYGNARIDGDLIVNNASSTQITVSSNSWHGNILISGNTISATDNSGLYLYDNASNGIFIDDGGNVGIASSTPYKTLGIVGQMYIDGSDTATSTIEGNFKICNEGCTHGIYWIFGSATSSMVAF